MDGYEFNKILGACTGALMIFLGLSFVSESIFGTGHGGHHGEEKLAFAMEIEPSEGEPEPEVITMAALMAEADASSGEKVFRKCSACHNAEPGGANGVGPALHGIMGREIAADGGYSYSEALAGLDGVWDWEAMNGFLTKPRSWAPGTKMGFAGLSKPDQRADLMAWLNEQSDTPIELPTE
ncbi:MAG: cytochrome c family protein [Pseudomonadota bacterium]